MRCWTTPGTRRARRSQRRTGSDGSVASILSLGTTASGETATGDPKLRALYDERRVLERRVESLQVAEGEHGAAEATRPSSRRSLTELALKSRQIREAGGKTP